MTTPDPCPFCGGDAYHVEETVIEGIAGFYRCAACDAEGPRTHAVPHSRFLRGVTSREALELWNKRKACER